MSYRRLLAWVATTHPEIVLLCDHSQAPRLPRTHTPLRLRTCVRQLPDYMVPELLLAGATSLALACPERTEVLEALPLAAVPTGLVMLTAAEVPVDQAPLPRRALLGATAHAPIDTGAAADVRLATALRALGVAYDRPTTATALHSQGCTACSVCVLACPNDALSLAGEGSTELIHDRTSCDSCQRCVRLCPSSALGSAGAVSLRTLANQPQVVLETVETARCTRCHQRFRPAEGEELCRTCAFRREHPFGAARPH
ncbi:4Fe-4S dicluster domain-containing protein [Corynebacterium guangdongense]|uniref:Ferredoxin n=1 Tax=Corynebacterium guangdongense TaxID=1783348 RepID=A0ABU1ZY34_9CORY|nr:4Fe-4S dicluster domain-containing protein [Corynebacterium guangdongense]MDR7329844.1 ferredoxin [Corynebacterium guangdongense]WJZ18407.1 ferredoxin [Corynebacterium guangdongense]